MSNESEQNKSVQKAREAYLAAQNQADQSEAQDARIPVDEAQLNLLHSRIQQPRKLGQVITQFAQILTD